MRRVPWKQREERISTRLGQLPLPLFEQTLVFKNCWVPGQDNLLSATLLMTISLGISKQISMETLACASVLEKPGFCFFTWHKGIIPTFPRKTVGGYGWVESKGIVSMVVIVGRQGWAATVLNKSHCDFVPKSVGNFFICLLLSFVSRHLECQGQFCAKPQKG